MQGIVPAAEYCAAVLPRRQRGTLAGLATMLIPAYLDESFDRPRRRAFITAAASANPFDWPKIEDRWEAELKKARIRYWKSSECSLLCGEFENRTQPDADAARVAFESCLEKCLGLISGYSVTVLMEDYRRVTRQPEMRRYYMPQPDVDAYRVAIQEVAADIRKDDPGHLVAYICDESNQFPFIEDAYDKLKIINPALAATMHSIGKADDTTSIPLQVADLVASIAHDVVDPWIRAGRPGGLSGISLGRWARLYTVFGVWDEAYMIANYNATVTSQLAASGVLPSRLLPRTRKRVAKLRRFQQTGHAD